MSVTFILHYINILSLYTIAAATISVTITTITTTSANSNDDIDKKHNVH